MKNALLFLVFLLFTRPILVNAQQEGKFSVLEFNLDQFDTAAKDESSRKYDTSGDLYAIVKVSSTNSEDKLEEYYFSSNNLNVIPVSKGDQLWLYVQKNAKRFTIKRKGYRTINDYDLHQTLQAGKTYRLVIENNGIEISKQLVWFKVKPEETNAVITVSRLGDTVSEISLGTINQQGELQKSLELGSYSYKVIAPGYKISSGKLRLNNKRETKEENITLIPDFQIITFEVGDNADIYIDGQYKGRGSWTGRVEAGAHEAESRKANCTSKKKNFTAVADAPSKKIVLDAPVPITTFVSVISSPSQANIFVDGKDTGLKTPQNVEMPLGQHVIKLEKQDYQSLSKTISVGDTSDEVFFDLSKEGKITIDTNPSNAQLYFNGNDVGYTPYTTTITTGEYNVQFVKEGYSTFSKKVHLDVNNSMNIYKLKREYQTRNANSFQAGVQYNMGGIIGVGLSYDYYKSNFNIEAGVFYNIINASFFIVDATTNLYTRNYEIKNALCADIKVGYGISFKQRFRFTPQAGIKLIRFSDAADLNISGMNTSLAIDAKLDYAISGHFGLSLTPEAAFSISKNANVKVLSDWDNKIKGMLSGFNLRFGLYYNF